MFWTVTLLGGLLLTAWTGRLRDLAAAASSAAPLTVQPTLTVIGYVVLLSLLNEVVSVPLAFYSGFVIERRYELSTETLSTWAGDQLKSFGVAVLLGGAAATIIYGLIRWSPDWWWLAAGIVFTILIVGLANLAPVLLLPLFYV